MSASLVVACPHCRRKNRVPVERLGEGGVCGACKQPLFAGHPLTLDSASLAAHLETDLPLVVDFWAPWCGPCRQFAPVFEQAARQLEPRLRLGKVDTEAQPALAQRYCIRSIPTLIVFHKGRELARMSGALPPAQFMQWVRDAVAKAGA